MARHYYAVRWAENVRFNQADDRAHACKLAYGMVADNMEVFDLGTRKHEALRQLRQLPQPIKHWHKCRKCGALFTCSLSTKATMLECSTTTGALDRNICPNCNK